MGTFHERLSKADGTSLEWFGEQVASPKGIDQVARALAGPGLWSDPVQMLDVINDFDDFVDGMDGVSAADPTSRDLKVDLVQKESRGHL